MVANFVHAVRFVLTSIAGIGTYLWGIGSLGMWCLVSWLAGIGTYLWGIGSRRAENGVDESEASFLLADDSGDMCTVDPEGAEMLLKRRFAQMDYFGNSVHGAPYWSLRAGEQIYVLGEFFTLGSIDSDLDTRHQISELLASWKANRTELLQRFDLNSDGEISEQEWGLARSAARREVERSQRETLATPQAHVMGKPRNGQLYLISDRAPTVLARWFWLWAIAHGMIFIATAATLTWLYEHKGGFA
jgi:hypothetical protein